MDAGKLCPPSIGHDMLQERLQQDDVRCYGYILDGFPREAANSEFLVREGASCAGCALSVLLPRLTGSVALRGR